jgi:hypothetical protein
VAEKPILFSTPMVRAILDGRKTMTRRVCKDIAGYDFKWGLDREPYIGNYKVFTKTEPGKWDWVTLENQWLYDLQTAVDDSRTHLLKCPYQPGDRLYVRETWYYESHMHELTAGEPDLPNGLYSHRYIYRASNPDYPVNVGVGEHGWKPSIHMPKVAARIWLEVTNVRVERLQEIAADDAKAEGVLQPGVIPSNTLIRNTEGSIPRTNFKILWDSLNAKRGYGWDSDPWVWVVSFKREQP